jgi:hypothetical protein
MGSNILQLSEVGALNWGLCLKHVTIWKLLILFGRTIWYSLLLLLLLLWLLLSVIVVVVVVIVVVTVVVLVVAAWNACVLLCPRCRLVFGIGSVLISAVTPALVIEKFRGFPQSLQVNDGIAPQNNTKCCASDYCHSDISCNRFAATEVKGFNSQNKSHFIAVNL